MRISGGAARGIPLAVPKGEAVRPATDGMRQAVFSSLGARVVGARFWDLFAGSGAYGKPTDAQVVTADALTWIPPAGVEAADLVFIDPPYEIIPQAARVLFAHLAVALAAKPDALVLLELPGGLSLAPEGWAELKRLGKGTHQPTVAVFHRR